MEDAKKKGYKPYQIHTDPKYSHHRQTSKYLGRGEASYSRGNLLSKFGINLYQKKGIWPDDGISTEGLSLLGPSDLASNAAGDARGPVSMWKTKRERWTWLMTLFTGTVILFLGRMAMPICEVEIMEEFHWNEEQLGRVMSVFFWGYAITQIPGGAAADIYGGGLTIAVSSFLWGTVCWVTPMITIGAGRMFGNGFAYYVLILLRIIMGLAQAIHFPSMSSVLSQNINDSSKAFAMSFVTSGSQFGTLVCGYLGSKLLALTNWKTVFVTFGVCGVLFSVYIFYLNKFSIKSMHRMISLTNLEDAPLLKPASNSLTAAISGPSSSSFITNPQLKHKNVKSQIFDAARNTLKLGHELMYKPSFLALVLVHMSNTNSVFVLSFWLPKYFHDKFPGALSPQYYNVIPWIGVIPGSILFGVLSDILVRRTKLSTSSIRRYIECTGVAGGAFFAHLLANGGMDIGGTLFVTALMIFVIQAHNASGMVNPQDLAPKHAGSVFGVMNSCGAIMSSFGIWFSGWLLEHYERDWSLVFRWIMIVNIVGGVMYFAFGSAKRLV